MAVLVQILSRYAPAIYAICAIAALYLLRVAILARRERRQAAFSLERETATNRTHGALRWAILLIAIMGATYFVSNYLTTAVEPIIAEADPTPTPVFLISTPTPTPEATPTVTETPTITPTPRPRATPRPVVTEPPPETPTPQAPVVVAANCPDARAVIIEPGANQQINGPVQVVGTAQTGSFQYYKIEFKPAGASGDFSFYARRDNPVVNGPLGTWDPSGLPAGAYQLRLVTVDATGNFGQCTVTVNVGG
ncbi:MAG: hypothetical protein KDI07_15715 [Anaerolineae bacterium]|nr:hypothetical protein [Anaerolineae bacterium]MCB0236484.1 hypothetical protein [Anaerolineae bacterium]MCB0240384.1 hypothetical protein [Anaerolineae bacterium]MCB0250022.1 hypothetical protein [Anaerolineae bacterium]